MKQLFLFLLLAGISSTLFAQWSPTPSNANNIYNTNTGNIGIGTNNPGYPLDVNVTTHNTAIVINDAQHAGDVSLWLRGASTGSANMILQALAGNSQAYWITGADGMLKIGANGGVEPTAGVININYQGNVGVGTTNPGSFKMAVEGALGARSIKVTAANPWPDYVFSGKYTLPSLSSVEKYITQNSHLPGMPSAAEVGQSGVDLGQMNAKLLEKVEELTLYVIQIKKENERILRENKLIKKQLKSLATPR
ncbi:MAG: hypothetical protein ABUL46_03020 [Chitinophaga rupis]